jgi:hypothetical protein
MHPDYTDPRNYLGKLYQTAIDIFVDAGDSVSTAFTPAAEAMKRVSKRFSAEELAIANSELEGLDDESYDAVVGGCRLNDEGTEFQSDSGTVTISLVTAKILDLIFEDAE